MSQLTIGDLEKCFKDASDQRKGYIGVLISMEGFPLPEAIINESANFDTKLAYYKKAYDKHLILKTFKGIRIIGFAHGNSFKALQRSL